MKKDRGSKMTLLKTELSCPNCNRSELEEITYEDLGEPFVHKCEKDGGGCGKWFAVKLELTLNAKCCKIFEGASSGSRDSSGERDES